MVDAVLIILSFGMSSGAIVLSCITVVENNRTRRMLRLMEQDRQESEVTNRWQG